MERFSVSKYPAKASGWLQGFTAASPSNIPLAQRLRWRASAPRVAGTSVKPTARGS